MTSAAQRDAAGASNARRREVITLLDSDSSEDDESAAGSPAAAALKSTNDDGRRRRNAPFVPFHLYETITSKSDFRKNHDTKKYFRTLRETIGLDVPRRKCQWLIVFNFLIDFTYLLEKLLPDVLRFRRVVVFYGSSADGDEGMDRWRRLLEKGTTGNTVEFVRLVPSDPPRSRTNPLPAKIHYGVHHTKMFLVGYEQGAGGDRSPRQQYCRVVVHTANLLLGDIEYKTQGAYCQDFPLKVNESNELSWKKTNQADRKLPQVANPYKRKREEKSDAREKSAKDCGWSFDEDDDVPFEEDLVTYLESYRYLTRQSWCSNSSASKEGLSDRPMTWLQLIRQYDYSSAYAVLIPSTPGRHKPDEYHNFGFLKLRRAVIDHACPRLQNSERSSSSSRPILCQFSSIGSLSEKWLNQFLAAVDPSTARSFDPVENDMGGKRGKNKQPPLASRMKIIWPTVDEIRRSVEGYRGGASVPGKIQNLSKDFLRPLFHRWSSRNSSDPLKTARHIPHIKTFVRPSSSDADGIDWIVLTSHNLSIAAWGQMQKRSADAAPDDKILFIRHWELGVFVSPATLANAAPGRAGCNVRMTPYVGISGDGDAVINVDSSDRDENENETTTPRIPIPLPFDMDPTAYGDDDVPWAVDRSCPVPDAFGCFMP